MTTLSQKVDRFVSDQNSKKNITKNKEEDFETNYKELYDFLNSDEFIEMFDSNGELSLEYWFRYNECLHENFNSYYYFLDNYSEITVFIKEELKFKYKGFKFIRRFEKFLEKENFKVTLGDKFKDDMFGGRAGIMYISLPKVSIPLQ